MIESLSPPKNQKDPVTHAEITLTRQLADMKTPVSANSGTEEDIDSSIEADHITLKALAFAVKTRSESEAE